MTLDQARDHWLQQLMNLRRLARSKRHRNPFVFLCAAALLESLAGLTTGKDLERQDYVAFVGTWLAEVDPMYRDFDYGGRSGRDLPTQMYLILRCGLVHTFSFVPGLREVKNGARVRAIVMNHRGPSWKHLEKCKVGGNVAARLVAEDFVEDLIKLCRLIFRKARKDHALEACILQRIREREPIRGGIWTERGD